MGFSIKLAPGVRIRASSRGIRTSLGPRAARVHVGAGRTGFSTGVGPVGFYTSVGGGRRGGGSGSSGSSAASYQRQLAAQQRQAVAAQRADQARELAQMFLRIIELHRVDFPPATPPVAPPPRPPGRAAIAKHYEQHGLAGIGVFRWSERAQARQRAAAWTEGEMQRQWAALCQQQAQWQQHLNHRWQQLCANAPDVVIETLEEAFADNEAPAAAVGVNGDEVSLVVLVPPAEKVVPERMPTTTQAGNLSFKKLPQGERAGYYQLFVYGQVLVTIREAFAVAPGIASARVVVLRNDGQDSYASPRVCCLAAARFDRHALNGVRWDTADAAAIVNDVSTELLLNQRGRTGDFMPVDLSAEPALTTLIEAVDLTELTATQASDPT